LEIYFLGEYILMENAIAVTTYKCEICGEEFSKKRELRAHMQEAHPVQEEPAQEMLVNEPDSSNNDKVESTAVKATPANKNNAGMVICKYCGKEFFADVIDKHIALTHLESDM
jgi:DNA-directed RNA polymerase subunit RPC12/RpoP